MKGYSRLFSELYQKKFSEQYNDQEKYIKGMRRDELWKILLKFDLRVCGKGPFLILTSKKKLTLARISGKHIYLNLFGGARFH